MTVLRITLDPPSALGVSKGPPQALLQCLGRLFPRGLPSISEHRILLTPVGPLTGNSETSGPALASHLIPVLHLPVQVNLASPLDNLWLHFIIN